MYWIRSEVPENSSFPRLLYLTRVLPYWIRPPCPETHPQRFDDFSYSNHPRRPQCHWFEKGLEKKPLAPTACAETKSTKAVGSLYDCLDCFHTDHNRDLHIHEYAGEGRRCANIDCLLAIVHNRNAVNARPPQHSGQYLLIHQIVPGIQNFEIALWRCQLHFRCLYSRWPELFLWRGPNGTFRTGAAWNKLPSC